MSGGFHSLQFRKTLTNVALGVFVGVVGAVQIAKRLVNRRLSPKNDR